MSNLILIQVREKENIILNLNKLVFLSHDFWKVKEKATQFQNRLILYIDLV